MIIYRPQRGRLVEAMKEAVEFGSELEMKEYIVRQWDNYFSVDDIVIDDEVANDVRIGWEDTRYVCTKRLGNQDYVAMYGRPQCIGMCATVYSK